MTNGGTPCKTEEERKRRKIGASGNHIKDILNTKTRFKDYNSMFFRNMD